MCRERIEKGWSTRLIKFGYIQRFHDNKVQVLIATFNYLRWLHSHDSMSAVTSNAQIAFQDDDVGLFDRERKYMYPWLDRQIGWANLSWFEFKSKSRCRQKKRVFSLLTKEAGDCRWQCLKWYEQKYSGILDGVVVRDGNKKKIKNKNKWKMF